MSRKSQNPNITYINSLNYIGTTVVLGGCKSFPLALMERTGVLCETA